MYIHEKMLSNPFRSHTFIFYLSYEQLCEIKFFPSLYLFAPSCDDCNDTFNEKIERKEEREKGSLEIKASLFLSFFSLVSRPEMRNFQQLLCYFETFWRFLPVRLSSIHVVNHTTRKLSSPRVSPKWSLNEKIMKLNLRGVSKFKKNAK